MSHQVLHTSHVPTVFNKEMAIGTLLFPIVGTIIGGYIGKNRMERENEVGKPVSEDPSFWNIDTLLGAQLGGTLAPVVVGAAAIAVGLLIAPNVVPNTFSERVINAVANLSLYMASTIGTVLGGYIGGRHGQQVARQEYVKALEQQAARSQEPSRGRGIEPSLEQERGRSDGKSWAQASEREAATIQR